MTPEYVPHHPSFWICIHIPVEVLVVLLTLPKKLEKLVKIIVSFFSNLLRLPASIFFSKKKPQECKKKSSTGMFAIQIWWEKNQQHLHIFYVLLCKTPHMPTII